MSRRFSWVGRLVGAAAVVLLMSAAAAYAVVPTLSQSSVTVGLGQSAAVTSQNGQGLYIGSNSSPTIASVSINGTQATVTGESLGTATISLCSVGTASDCTNLFVTVQATSVSGISFNPSSPVVSVGGNQTITVSGGNGTYSISSNSNTSVASTNLSGSTLTVSGLAAGGATIRVCDSSSNCGNLSVTVNSATAATTTASVLLFSQNNLYFTAGSSETVGVSGGSGTYSITNNSNPTDVSVGISGTEITVSGSAAGSDTVTVCDTEGHCGTLTATVTASTVSQAVTFNPTAPSLAVGQNLTVALSGGTSGYILFNNTNAGIAQASIVNAASLSLTGVSAGTDPITVCATAGGCSPVTVTVTGPATTATSPIATTPATTTPAPVATTPATVPTVQPAAVVVNSTLLTEIQALQTLTTQALAQIQSIQTQLSQLEAQVSAGSGSGISASASSAVSASGASYDFTELLTLGSQDAEVTALQERLATLGFYSGPITGYYGALTQSAVSKYQTSHGITATGYVGPSTRAALNSGS